MVWHWAIGEFIQYGLRSFPSPDLWKEKYYCVNWEKTHLYKKKINSSSSRNKYPIEWQQSTLAAAVVLHTSQQSPLAAAVAIHTSSSSQHSSRRVQWWLSPSLVQVLQTLILSVVRKLVEQQETAERHGTAGDTRGDIKQQEIAGGTWHNKRQQVKHGTTRDS